MAVKYKRIEPESRGYRRRAESLAPPRMRLTSKRSFVLLYLSLFGLALLLLLQAISTHSIDFAGQPVTEAQATIAAKTIETVAFGAKRYVLKLDVRLPAERVLTANYATSEAVWGQYAEGDWVTVGCQVSKTGDRVRVRSIAPAPQISGEPEPY